MGIDVALVNEDHEWEQEVFDLQQHLTKLATSAWPELSASICLRFIDPWGDTVFNQAQIPVLMNELKQSEQEQTDEEIKKHLRKVIRLVERAEGCIHTYIKFVGD
jgi:hypothetical protein